MMRKAPGAPDSRSTRMCAMMLRLCQMSAQLKNHLTFTHLGKGGNPKPWTSLVKGQYLQFLCTGEIQFWYMLPGCKPGSPLTIQIHFPPFLYHKMSYRWIYTMYKHIKLQNSCLYKMSLNLILSSSKLKQSFIVYAVCAIILCNLIILMKAIIKCYK